MAAGTIKKSTTPISRIEKTYGGEEKKGKIKPKGSGGGGGSDFGSAGYKTAKDQSGAGETGVRYALETKVGDGTKREFYIWDTATGVMRREYRDPNTGGSVSGRVVATIDDLNERNRRILPYHPELVQYSAGVRSSQDAVGIGSQVSYERQVAATGGSGQAVYFGAVGEEPQGVRTLERGRESVGLVYQPRQMSPEERAEREFDAAHPSNFDADAWYEGQDANTKAFFEGGMSPEQGEFFPMAPFMSDEYEAVLQSRQYWKDWENANKMVYKIMSEGDIVERVGFTFATMTLSSEDFLGVPSALMASRGDIAGYAGIKARALVDLESARGKWDQIITKAAFSPVMLSAYQAPIMKGLGAIERGLGAISPLASKGFVSVSRGVSLGIIGGELGYDVARLTFGKYDATIRREITDNLITKAVALAPMVFLTAKAEGAAVKRYLTEPLKGTQRLYVDINQYYAKTWDVAGRTPTPDQSIIYGAGATRYATRMEYQTRLNKLLRGKPIIVSAGAGRREFSTFIDVGKTKPIEISTDATIYRRYIERPFVDKMQLNFVVEQFPVSLSGKSTTTQLSFGHADWGKTAPWRVLDKALGGKGTIAAIRGYDKPSGVLFSRSLGERELLKRVAGYGAIKVSRPVGTFERIKSLGMFETTTRGIPTIVNIKKGFVDVIAAPKTPTISPPRGAVPQPPLLSGGGSLQVQSFKVPVAAGIAERAVAAVPVPVSVSVPQVRTTTIPVMMPAVKTAVMPMPSLGGQISINRQKSATSSVVIGGVLQGTRQKQRQNVALGSIQMPQIALKTGEGREGGTIVIAVPKMAQGSITEVASRQDYRTIAAMKSARMIMPYFPAGFGTPRAPTGRPLSIPNLGFDIGGSAGRARPGGKKGKGRRSYDYFPSLGGVYLNIKSPTIPRGLFTGAEIRPIIKIK